jgi:hypothetical protein
MRGGWARERQRETQPRTDEQVRRECERRRSVEGGERGGEGSLVVVHLATGVSLSLSLSLPPGRLVSLRTWREREGH